MKRFVARLNVKSGVSYPSLDVELRKELNDFFAVQVQELEERLGRHLNEWSPRDTE